VRRTARAAGIVFVVLALFVGWYWVASDYDYAALAGTYTFSGNGASSALVLKSDRTFQQLRYDGRVEQANGTWRRIGEGGVAFSAGFLRLPGATTALQEFPDSSPDDPNANIFYGHFEKVFGIYPELHLNANPPGPTYYKQLLH
jgi:hypothetical protein